MSHSIKDQHGKFGKDLVYEVIAASDKPLSPKDIYTELGKQKTIVKMSTLYTCLMDLVTEKKIKQDRPRGGYYVPKVWSQPAESIPFRFKDSYLSDKPSRQDWADAVAAYGAGVSIPRDEVFGPSDIHVERGCDLDVNSYNYLCFHTDGKTSVFPASRLRELGDQQYFSDGDELIHFQVLCRKVVRLKTIVETKFIPVGGEDEE